MLSFNFNKKKETGLKQVFVGDKLYNKYCSHWLYSIYEHNTNTFINDI